MNRSILEPFNRPRPWVTLLVALAVAVGFSGLWLARAKYHDHMRQHNLVMLLPERPMTDSDRRAALARFAAEGLEARWLSPADQSRLIADRLPGRLLGDAYPADEGWFPWILKLRPADPLRPLDGLVARVEREGDWIAFHDGAALDEAGSLYGAFRAGLWGFSLLALVSGAAALSRMPPPGGIEWAGTALLGTAAPAAVWLLAAAGGAGPDGRTMLAAALAGFLVAGAVAPMLRQRRQEDAIESAPGGIP